ncbi:hypothetical protein CMV_009690 [Castanea mollissima]|uniref:Uncharacterized protein n=1 Tax=Castanea mollissima TaxID=60419 RepID=A0A8J4VQM7_9ROSI|nr:hypothetical protein CMV_009690 [Castanea mollissima]
MQSSFSFNVWSVDCHYDGEVRKFGGSEDWFGSCRALGMIRLWGEIRLQLMSHLYTVTFSVLGNRCPTGVLSIIEIKRHLCFR